MASRSGTFNAGAAKASDFLLFLLLYVALNAGRRPASVIRARHAPIPPHAFCPNMHVHRHTHTLMQHTRVCKFLNFLIVRIQQCDSLCACVDDALTRLRQHARLGHRLRHQRLNFKFKFNGICRASDLGVDNGLWQHSWQAAAALARA